MATRLDGYIIVLSAFFAEQASAIGFPPGLVAEAEAKARGLLHEARLDAIMEVAYRAERKGEIKKALGQYYEAQYFLEHEDIERSLQVRVLRDIRTRIAELDEELSLSLSDRVGYRH